MVWYSTELEEGRKILKKSDHWWYFYAAMEEIKYLNKRFQGNKISIT